MKAGRPAPDAASAIDCARWLLRRRSRMALSPVTGLGMLLVVTIAILGASREAARASLARSQVALAAMTPAPVPGEENAAPIWHSAVDASVLPDRQEEAVELCWRAAGLPRCDWQLTLDPTDPDSTSLDYHFELSRLGTIVSAHALAAAERADWSTVALDLEASLAMSEDVRYPVLISYLVATGFSDRTIQALDATLAVPGADPPAAVLARLERLAVRARSQLSWLADALEGERRYQRINLDLAGSGFVTGFDGNELVGFELFDPSARLDLPASLSPWSLSWPWQRRLHQEGFEILCRAAAELDREPGRKEVVGRTRRALQQLESAVPFLLQQGVGQDLELMLGALRRPVRLITRWQQRAIALAAMRAAQAGGGQWPDDLDELELPEEVLADPCAPDGARMQVHVEESGALILSSDRADRDPGLVFRAYLPGSIERVRDEDDDLEEDR